jgi:uncharacterized membrane protein
MSFLDVSTVAAATATFFASALEFVEALAIVLAIGVSRGWRAALAGTLAASGLLIVVSVLAGATLAVWFPQSGLRLLVGSLLLIFGLLWLRKAVHKLAIGGRPGHWRPSEAPVPASGPDWFAFGVVFKGVLLEGAEVVFIVLTIGGSSGRPGAAVTGAVAAAVAVLLVGLLIRRTFGRLPQTYLGIAVGVLLASFGTFWAVAGLVVFDGTAAATWPGSDWALLGLLGVWTATALLAPAGLRHGTEGRPHPPGRPARPRNPLLQFGYKLVVGEDWRVAAGVLTSLGVTALAVAFAGLPPGLAGPAVTAGCVATLLVSLFANTNARTGTAERQR